MPPMTDDIPDTLETTAGAPGDDLVVSRITEVARTGRAPELPRRVRLSILSGPDAGRELDLAHATYVVGKSSSATVRLTDPQVSRRHLEVTLDEGGIVLRDLQSKNGSFIAATRFFEVRVALGTVVRIGNTELRFSSINESTALPPSGATHFGRLLGRSLAMRRLYAVLERVAQSDVPVLVGGETGTGKELAAEAIHLASRVAQGPFVVCDLAGVARSLIESELFGYVRGAFTGADRDREGAFQRADRGSIFIDEVGELEMAVQPRLLRVLEQQQVKPVGASVYRTVQIRVISATNRDLAAECKAGRFREDLFHRLAGVRVTLPPLRERKEDIPLLVESWLGPRGVEAHPEVLAILMEHDWPGNVRELRNVVQRGLSLLAPGERVLDPTLLGLHGDPTQPPTLSGASLEGHYKRAKDNLIATWERAFIENLLKRAKGNISQAARDGGLDRAYLYRLMRKYDLRADDV